MFHAVTSFKPHPSPQACDGIHDQPNAFHTQFPIFLGYWMLGRLSDPARSCANKPAR